MTDRLEELFLKISRAPYNQLIIQVQAAGYTKSIDDIYSTELNNILVSNGWNMDNFIDEYNKTASRGNRYRVFNITSAMFITKPHV